MLASWLWWVVGGSGCVSTIYVGVGVARGGRGPARNKQKKERPSVPPPPPAPARGLLYFARKEKSNNSGWTLPAAFADELTNDGQAS